MGCTFTRGKETTKVASNPETEVPSANTPGDIGEKPRKPSRPSISIQPNFDFDNPDAIVRHEPLLATREVMCAQSELLHDILSHPEDMADFQQFALVWIRMIAG